MEWKIKKWGQDQSLLQKYKCKVPCIFLFGRRKLNTVREDALWSLLISLYRRLGEIPITPCNVLFPIIWMNSQQSFIFASKSWPRRLVLRAGEGYFQVIDFEDGLWGLVIGKLSFVLKVLFFFRGWRLEEMHLSQSTEVCKGWHKTGRAGGNEGKKRRARTRKTQDGQYYCKREVWGTLYSWMTKKP